MRCEKCGFQNEENLKFCGNCGNPLAVQEQLIISEENYPKGDKEEMSEEELIEFKKLLEKKARSMNAIRYRNAALISGGICLLGIIITSLSFNSVSGTGGSYTICWGAILIGGIYCIINLIKWLSHK